MEEVDKLGPVGTLATDAVITGLNEGKVVASDVGATVTGISGENMLQYLYELCWAAAKGSLQVDKLAVGIKAAGVAGDADALALQLAETMWLVWQELDGDSLAEHRTRLAALAQQLMNKDQMVTKRLLREVMDQDFFVEAGFVASGDVWKRKEVKVNTKLFYAQNKFNLMREESEGFAKLATSLNQFGGSAMTDASVDAMVMEIKSLIGFFDLDPSRVYDIILDAFQEQPHNLSFIRLMPMFSPEAITHVLGLNFQRAHKEGKGTSQALCLVAAAVLKAKLVTLEALLGHLEPSEDDLRALQKAGAKRLQDAVANLGVINLADSSKEAEGKRTKMGITADQLDLDARGMMDVAVSGLAQTSQQLALLEGLLLVDDWESAKRLGNLLQKLGIRPAEHAPVAQALCKLLSARLAPLVLAQYPRGLRGRSMAEVPSTAPPSFSEEVQDMLRLLGIHLYHDQRLAFQIARLVRHSLQVALRRSIAGSETEQTAARAELALAETVLQRTLLPAMTMIPATPALPHEIWAMLKLFPYTTRFRHYYEWRASIERTPLLQAAAKKASQEVKKVVRRLHVAKDKADRKEGMKPFSRLIGKAAHSSPFSTLLALINQVESYANLADPVIQGMSYLTPMGFDVLTFLIIDKLASSGRQKLKEDGVNIADWLKALSVLTAGVCKKYPDQMGINAICQYLANQLKARDGFDLLILNDLIKSMTGIEAVSEMSDAQVEACAGGELLRIEAVYFQMQKNTKRTAEHIQQLRSALQEGPFEQQLALPLLILICQQRDALTVISAAKDIKFITEQLDACQQSLLQYTDFLQKALSMDEYAALLPPLDDLVHVYGLQPSTALTLHRPLLAHLTPPASLGAKAEEEEGEIEEHQPMETSALPNGDVADASRSSADQEAWDGQVAAVRALYPASVWEHLSPEFMLVFWSLGISDIFLPTARYEQELAQMQQALKVKESALKEAKAAQEYAKRMTRNNHAADPFVSENPLDIPATEKEIARLTDAVKRLPAELRHQAKRVAEVESILRRVKETLPKTRSKGAVDVFLQHCIQPRMAASPQDAFFCSKVVQKLHELSAAINPLSVLHKTTNLMRPLLAISTDMEAASLGIFYNANLQLMEHWGSSEVVYTTECLGHSTFLTLFHDPSSQPIDFKTYSSVLESHRVKVHTILSKALKFGDFVQIKNALLILARIVKVFPKEYDQARALQSAAEDIVKRGKAGKETREDILNMANNYHAILSAEIRRPGRIQGAPIPAKAAKGAKPPAVPASAGNKAAAKAAVKAPAAAPKAAREQQATPQASVSGIETPEPGQIKAEANGAVKTEGAPQSTAVEPASRQASGAIRERKRDSATDGGKADVRGNRPEATAKAEPIVKTEAGVKRAREAIPVPDKASEKVASGRGAGKTSASTDAKPPGLNAGGTKAPKTSPLRPDAASFMPKAEKLNPKEGDPPAQLDGVAIDGERHAKRPRSETKPEPASAPPARGKGAAKGSSPAEADKLVRKTSKRLSGKPDGGETPRAGRVSEQAPERSIRGTRGGERPSSRERVREGDNADEKPTTRSKDSGGSGKSAAADAKRKREDAAAVATKTEKPDKRQRQDEKDRAKQERADAKSAEQKAAEQKAAEAKAREEALRAMKASQKEKGQAGKETTEAEETLNPSRLRNGPGRPLFGQALQGIRGTKKAEAESSAAVADSPDGAGPNDASDQVHGKKEKKHKKEKEKKGHKEKKEKKHKKSVGDKEESEEPAPLKKGKAAAEHVPSPSTRSQASGQEGRTSRRRASSDA